MRTFRRGMTMLEVLIWAVLCGMAALAVGSLFILGRSAQQTTLSGYLVSGEGDLALRWLRRDIQETALVSLRTYPNAAQAAQPPGCSMVSGRTVANAGPEVSLASPVPLEPANQFNVSQYGTPLWAKHVFYSLKPGSDGRRGQLIRWEQAIPSHSQDFVPRPSNILPNAFAVPATQKVILQNVLLPNQTVKNLQKIPGEQVQSDKYGGFKVQFLQRIGGEDGNEQLVEINPGDASQPQNSANNTRLVYVRLQILQDDRHEPNFFQIEFKLHPRF